MKKSIETSVPTWLVRKVRHVCDGWTTPGPQESRDRAFRHLEAKRAQLTVDARRSPEGIRCRRLDHQDPNRGHDGGAARPGELRAPDSPTVEPLAVPPQDRVGSHEHEGRAPRPPPVGKEDPEEPTPFSELRALDGALQGDHLLRKRHILQSDRLMPTARQQDGSEQDEDRRQHVPMVSCLGTRINLGGRRSRFGEPQSGTDASYAPLVWNRLARVHFPALLNAFIKRFNRTYREKVLDAYEFHCTHEAEQCSAAWLIGYSEH